MTSAIMQGVQEGIWLGVVAGIFSRQKREHIIKLLSEDKDMSRDFYTYFCKACNGVNYFPGLKQRVRKMNINEMLCYLTVENVYKGLHRTRHKHNLWDLLYTARGRMWITEMVSKIKMLVTKYGIIGLN